MTTAVWTGSTGTHARTRINPHSLDTRSINTYPALSLKLGHGSRSTSVVDAFELPISGCGASKTTPPSCVLDPFATQL